MIDIPHHWPGKKKLAQLLAALRVLGVTEPPHFDKYDNDSKTYGYIPYSKLSKKRQKEVYFGFRIYVQHQLEKNQQEKR